MARYDFLAVYILSNQKRGTLYIGSTSDLLTRLEQHRSGSGSQFTSKYRLDKLVWFEPHDDLDAMARRENALKRWKRDWKIELIERENPDWRDLALDF